MGFPVGNKGAEKIAHVVKTSEVDLAILLPFIPLSTDHKPLILGCIQRHRKTQIRGRDKQGKENEGTGRRGEEGLPGNDRELASSR